MILDYLTSNGLRKYPFDDSATLQNEFGVVLPNDFFLDLLVASKLPTATGAFVHKISNNVEEFFFTLGFTLFDSDGNAVHTFEFDLPFDQVVEKEFYGIADESVAVKIVFGRSFISKKSVMLDLVFTKQAATLAGSAFVPMVPRVKSVAFYNWDNELNGPKVSPTAYFYGDEVDTLENITLKEGYNTSFSESTQNKIIWDVIPGAGAGIYDDCDSNTGIKTINGIEPDRFDQNFLMAADECYQVFPGIKQDGDLIPQNATLSFFNTCTPKCTSDDLKGFANYLNRIRDGTASVFAYAANAYQIIKDEIDWYRDTVDVAKLLPRYDVRWIKNVSVTGKLYFSIAASFTNPTTDPQMLYLTVATEGRIPRFKYKINNVTTILEDTNMLDVAVPCETTLYVDLVISTWNPVEVQLTGAFGVTTINFSAQLV